MAAPAEKKRERQPVNNAEPGRPGEEGVSECKLLIWNLSPFHVPYGSIWEPYKRFA